MPASGPGVGETTDSGTAQEARHCDGSPANQVEFVVFMWSPRFDGQAGPARRPSVRRDHGPPEQRPGTRGNCGPPGTTDPGSPGRPPPGPGIPPVYRGGSGLRGDLGAPPCTQSSRKPRSSRTMPGKKGRNGPGRARAREFGTGPGWRLPGRPARSHATAAIRPGLAIGGPGDSQPPPGRHYGGSGPTARCDPGRRPTGLRRHELHVTGGQDAGVRPVVFHVPARPETAHGVGTDQARVRGAVARQCGPASVLKDPVRARVS